ncbi:XRE family transcriptional regulator [Flavonifractor sp. An9]|uniref:XRE family transcriptional regulator n=1 Tax=Flavonifractor sp. An9 TaxID=1965664 RepID=UPI001FA843D9|nr:XRE family transcriptional regulator [Flavonifractor sp. An9]
MNTLTEFGKTIKKRLIDMNKNQVWLIEQVREETGLYFDSSYLYKISTGRLNTPSIVGGIRKILDLPVFSHDTTEEVR